MYAMYAYTAVKNFQMVQHTEFAHFFVLGSDTFSQMQLFLLPYLKQRICIVHCHIPKWNGGTDDTTHLFSYQPRICCRW